MARRAVRSKDTKKRAEKVEEVVVRGGAGCCLSSSTGSRHGFGGGRWLRRNERNARQEGEKRSD
jgi:hypothetical protein